MRSNEGDIVLDIFNGSGTVPKVAEEPMFPICFDKELEYCLSIRVQNRKKEIKRRIPH